ncbi:zinc-binding dehydrogenase [Pseudonocardia sp. TRM90224]|uniref:zinc-binding dehydrogenase n=1 Tax=Pseudonocardia sp. TRM90224 TaxID=2812678 RepID=UPI001E32316B|nr:zinc-binding dehydrogenase [Pseudonocardia sp. TRM90224]
MKAVVVRTASGIEGIELIDAQVPEPGPGQVRIAVEAAAVNPVDLAVASGALVALGVTAARPQFGLGWDVAGRVDAVGAGVELAVGTAVVGLADLVGRPLKTHAEHVVLDAGAVVAAPQDVEPVAASTFALNASTAHQALAALDLPPGSSVLVTGAAGGVGGYAVELAAHRGLAVVATAGDADEELVRDLGADVFVPRSADLATTVRERVPGGVDGVVDAAVLGVAAEEAVRNDGGFVSLSRAVVPPPLRGITVHPVFVKADAGTLAELAGLAAAGVISTRVAETYPLVDATHAYRRQAKGGVRGRVVLVP